MKLQALALGLAFAVAGTAFAATKEVTVTKDTPHGVVTKHLVRTNDMDRVHHRHVKKVVMVSPHHRHVKKVVIVHPAHHGRYAVNRTVVIHRHG
jgi:NAD(P)H-dependent flavin oxidoreductase YrpB (nitropropane dioxygenase family)